MGVLNQFKSFFEGKELDKGTNVLLMYRTDATLDVVLRQGDGTDYGAVSHRRLVMAWAGAVMGRVEANLSLASASLCCTLCLTSTS